MERPRDAQAVTDTSFGASEWLIDGYNVIQVTLLGGADRSAWWRREARDRLIERASELPRALGRIWIVFDGPDPAPPPNPGDQGPLIVFAPSADEWILGRVRRHPDAAATVVTADRQLGDRCRHAGARVIAPNDFVAACRPAAQPLDSARPEP